MHHTSSIVQSTHTPQESIAALLTTWTHVSSSEVLESSTFWSHSYRYQKHDVIATWVMLRHTAKMISPHGMVESMHVCNSRAIANLLDRLSSAELRDVLLRSATEVWPLLLSVLNSVHELTQNGTNSYALALYGFLLSSCQELAIALFFISIFKTSKG